MSKKYKHLTKESKEIVSKALSVTYSHLNQLRYSEIEVFLKILKEELKRASYFNGAAFEKPPKI